MRPFSLSIRDLVSNSRTTFLLRCWAVVLCAAAVRRDKGGNERCTHM
jgi:hypothetical protein